MWTASSGSSCSSRVGPNSSCAERRPKLKSDRAIKPTRLAAEEFEENQIRWDYGEEGGVLEPATDEIEEEEVMDEEEEAVSSRD